MSEELHVYYDDHSCGILTSSYTPHDPNERDHDSQFTCAMADKFTLENLILHGTRDGMAADSSWRNKNENRAAVTFLITVDENQHLLPGESASLCLYD